MAESPDISVTQPEAEIPNVGPALEISRPYRKVLHLIVEGATVNDLIDTVPEIATSVSRAKEIRGELKAMLGAASLEHLVRQSICAGLIKPEEVKPEVREAYNQNPMTASQREVLWYGSFGHSTFAMAERLHITEGAIKERKNAAFRRMQVRGRSTLAIWRAFGLGVLHENDDPPRDEEGIANVLVPNNPLGFTTWELALLETVTLDQEVLLPYSRPQQALLWQDIRTKANAATNAHAVSIAIQKGAMKVEARPQTVNLTTHERHVLNAIAHGRAEKVIAQDLSLADLRAIDDYRFRCRQKLGLSAAATDEALVKRAFEIGVITADAVSFRVG